VGNREHSLLAVNPAPALKRGVLGPSDIKHSSPVINHGLFCGVNFLLAMGVLCMDFRIPSSDVLFSREA
jgi:hypothetical protein